MSDSQHPRDHARPSPVESSRGRPSSPCTFCGGTPTEAVVGSPEGEAPILWQVAACSEYLTDLIMTRFAAVKHQRTVALAKDMTAAASEIVKLRSRAQREKRDFAGLRPEERHAIARCLPTR